MTVPSDRKEAGRLLGRLVEGSPSDVWAQQDVYEFVAGLLAVVERYENALLALRANPGMLWEERRETIAAALAGTEESA